MKPTRRRLLDRAGRMRAAGIAAALVGLVMAAHPGAADGILVPERPDSPNFAIKHHRVEVTVDNQVATTRIDQVFENRTNAQQEATYVFPLPHGAVIRGFILHDEGRPLRAELLGRDKATEIYESIVRKRRDPGLLEYMGRDTYRVRVYPIPAKGTKRIELEYDEVLRLDSGVVSYVYPLSTEKFSSAPIEEVKVRVAIKSGAPIGAVYSPTHDLQIARPDGHRAVATLEEHGTRPATDLILHYAVAQQEIATTVLTHKEPGGDGFFLMMVAPPPGSANGAAQPKDVVFVLDRSGSMSGRKIEQAKAALAFFLDNLGDKDRFRVITFSDTVRVHQGPKGLIPASPDNLAEAQRSVEEITASGGTDIRSALEAALATGFSEGRPGYVLFLTDGQPTVGETKLDTIARDVKQWNSRGDRRVARLFVFGAGYDVNTHFLENLAQGNGGVTEYVRPNEDIEAKVSRFFAKVARPILTEITLNVDKVETYDVFPREMPDLFAGSQLLVFGRYRAEQTVMARASLIGHASPKRKQFEAAVRFPAAEDRHPYLAPLWAARKIGWLLDEVMLRGEQKELIDEIVALSTRYGILTEYTAFLAEEGSAADPVARRERTADNVRAAYKSQAGAWATSQRQNAQAMRGQSSLAMQNVQYDREGNLVRLEQAQTRNNQAFFNRAGNWEDARYRQDVHGVVQVKAYSEAYFQLGRRDPALNQYLSLGERVLVVLNGQAIQIAAQGKESFTEKELDRLLGPKRSAPRTQSPHLGPGGTPSARGSYAVAVLGALSLALGCLAAASRRRPRQ